jgi:iron complex outermembrane recepter protein
MHRLATCVARLVAATSLALATTSLAQDRLAQLADLSLEQLADIVVTTASRQEQRLSDVATSIYVITSEDIRRSGVRTLPEALRLAPNLQVARADTNQYAITARGFGNVLANKLLVLIDGRTVYSPLFSGVFWEARDIMLEDIDRIEVISGPGTTLWGTNAVNGVINVISRSAQATQGTLSAGGGGNREWSGAVRHGGEAGGGHYRVYARAIDLDDSERANGTSVFDASRRVRAGFRYDRHSGADSLTVQGDAYLGDIDQPAGDRDIAGGNVLARWTRRLGDDSIVEVQAYYDRSDLDQTTFRDRLDTFDIEAQLATRVAEIHRVVAGGGYRLQRDRSVPAPTQAFIPNDRNLHTAYLFAQDEITLPGAVTLVGGVKLEHNEYTGVEVLPNVRLSWRFAPDALVWTALSRAVRAPSRVDREFFTPGQPPFVLNGGPGFESEVANVAELGVRGRVTTQFSYSATAFHHDWNRLRSVEQQPGVGLVFANGIEGSSSGIEAWATYTPFQQWRLSAGGTWLRQRLHARPGVADFGGLAALGNDPKRTLVARSSFDLPHRQELDLIVRYVSERPNPNVPAYTALDVRWGWHVDDRIEVSLTAENVGNPLHAEWGSAINRVEFERAYFAKILIRF